ncbi:helix-turn-helix domain-containing protein, partial [Shigella flexneri]|nr:helix-turn-helix domain-containing protein [Shigella flexneri]
KVHPRDVVSIPIDYNDAKMRTCQYEVVEDVTEQFK